MMRGISIVVLCAVLAACNGEPDRVVRREAPKTAEVFVVRSATVPTLKSAFAIVESPDAVAARARIGGTLTQLLVDEGSEVRRGQPIALVFDESLAPRAAAPRAQADALRAQARQAEADVARYEALHAKGFYPTQALEAAKAESGALRDQAAAMDAEAGAVAATAGQGRILAPVSGRVLKAPLTRGSTVMPGDQVALIGSSFVLRVRLPERHAAALRPGATVLVEQLGGARSQGVVAKVYPALVDGRIEADVAAPGIGAGVYGQRVRVWVPGEPSAALIVPSSYLSTRYGVDFAKVQDAKGAVSDVVVRRGEPRPAPDMPDGVEILAGLKAGDRLVR